MGEPAPLLPTECDLRGLEWMPLYGDRLFASDTWLMAGPEGRCAALTLWWAAWKQFPAGSLPDHDIALAQLAGYGAAVKAWIAIKAEAMRGWVKCDDGRLYHPIVCKFALEAWDRRVKERDRKASYRAKKDGTDASRPRPVPRDDHGTIAGQTTGQDAEKYGDGHVERTGQDRRGQEKESVSLRSTARTRADWQEDPDFLAFWNPYPRKTEGPAACWKAWLKARALSSAAEVIAGVLRYPFKPDFLPMAATWLNQQRWTTQADTPPPTAVLNGSRDTALAQFSRAIDALDDEPSDLLRLS
jgi:hypothetical protein